MTSVNMLSQQQAILRKNPSIRVSHILLPRKLNLNEGKRYKCDQCNYAATTARSLKIHKEAKHEGIRYPWYQCDYAATTASALKKQ